MAETPTDVAATATADIPAGTQPITVNVHLTPKAMGTADMTEDAPDDLTAPVVTDEPAKTIKPGHLAYKAIHDGIGGAVTGCDAAMKSCESAKMQKAVTGFKGGLRKLHTKMLDAAAGEYADDDDWDAHRKGLDDIYGPDGIPDTGDEPDAEADAEGVTVNVDADGDEPDDDKTEKGLAAFAVALKGEFDALANALTGRIDVLEDGLGKAFVRLETGVAAE